MPNTLCFCVHYQFFFKASIIAVTLKRTSFNTEISNSHNRVRPRSQITLHVSYFTHTIRPIWAEAHSTVTPGIRRAAGAAAPSRQHRTRAAVPSHAAGAAGSSHHRFETEWLTHPVLAPTPLRQMQTSKAKFKLQTEVTRVLVMQYEFPRTQGAVGGRSSKNHTS